MAVPDGLFIFSEGLQICEWYQSSYLKRCIFQNTFPLTIVYLPCKPDIAESEKKKTSRYTDLYPRVLLTNHPSITVELAWTHTVLLYVSEQEGDVIHMFLQTKESGSCRW